MLSDDDNMYLGGRNSQFFIYLIRFDKLSAYPVTSSKLRLFKSHSTADFVTIAGVSFSFTSDIASFFSGGISNFSTITSVNVLIGGVKNHPNINETQGYYLPEAVAKLSSKGASAANSMGESTRCLLRASTDSEIAIKTERVENNRKFFILF